MEYRECRALSKRADQIRCKKAPETGAGQVAILYRAHRGRGPPYCRGVARVRFGAWPQRESSGCPTGTRFQRTIRPPRPRQWWRHTKGDPCSKTPDRQGHDTLNEVRSCGASFGEANQIMRINRGALARCSLALGMTLGEEYGKIRTEPSKERAPYPLGSRSQGREVRVTRSRLLVRRGACPWTAPDRPRQVQKKSDTNPIVIKNNTKTRPKPIMMPTARSGSGLPRMASAA